VHKRKKRKQWKKKQILKGILSITIVIFKIVFESLLICVLYHIEIGYTRRRKSKQKHNIICVEHHYTQTNTNDVNKTWLQTIGGKDEPNIILLIAA
jgi:hypothetical protein